MTLTRPIMITTALTGCLLAATQAAQACAGDLTDNQGELAPDGQVQSSDLIRFLGSWGQSDLSCDFDGDEEVQIMDLLMLLERWGACPLEMHYGQVRTTDLIEPQDAEASPHRYVFNLQGEIGAYLVQGEGGRDGGQIETLYGTTDSTWPTIDVNIELNSNVESLAINAWLHVPAESMRISIIQKHEDGDLDYINIWNLGDGPPDGEREFGLQSDALEAGEYILRMSGMVHSHNLIGQGFGMSWSLEE